MFYEVDNVCFSYYKKPLCLKDVSFSMKKGDRLLVLAKHDEGKTTLLKVVSGFETSYFGKVFCEGNEIRNIEDNKKNFSLLLSEPVLLKDKTIRFNLDFLCEACGIAKLSDDDISELLNQFKIDREQKVKVKKLSLFEKRKLAILRSYIKNPKILFLDDQFYGLSEDEQIQMREIYNILFGNKNITIITVAEPSSFKSNREFFEKLNFENVGYLNLSVLKKFENIGEFLNSYIDRDIFEFLEDFEKFECEIKNQNNEFFFITDKNKYIKFDNNFNNKICKTLNENEDIEKVDVFVKKGINIDAIKDSEFNKLINNKDIFIYLKFDGTKVI